MSVAKEFTKAFSPDKKKLDAIITDLAGDLKPLVEKIEKRPATTQNHYGDYLGLIGQFAKGSKVMGQIVVAALLEAGANHSGVASAYKISFGA